MKTYILLDRSSSMASKWNDTLKAINSYVKALKGRDQNIFLALFDNINEGLRFEHARECLKKDWKPLTTEEFRPHGSTPLNDALATMILKMLSENEERAVLVVMTDGHENCSKNFSKKSVKEMMKTVNNKDWQVVFLGAEFEDIKDQSNDYGVDYVRRGIISSTENYSSTYNELAKKVNVYANAPRDFTSVQLAATMDFSAEEQDKLKGK